jgi:hypothetical protein
LLLMLEGSTRPVAPRFRFRKRNPLSIIDGRANAQHLV